MCDISKSVKAMATNPTRNPTKAAEKVANEFADWLESRNDVETLDSLEIRELARRIDRHTQVKASVKFNAMMRLLRRKLHNEWVTARALQKMAETSKEVTQRQGVIDGLLKVIEIVEGMIKSK